MTNSTCTAIVIEGVASFKILPDGGLELMNKASVNGLRPCYLSVDRANRYLLTAGYHDGKLTVLRLNEDGTIQGVTDEVFMKGLAVLPEGITVVM